MTESQSQQTSETPEECLTFMEYVNKIQECSDLMESAANSWIDDANATYQKTGLLRDAQIQSLAFGAVVAADNFKKYAKLMSNRAKEISSSNQT